MCKTSLNGTFVLRNEEEARSYFLTHSLIVHGLSNIYQQRWTLCDEECLITWSQPTAVMWVS